MKFLITFLAIYVISGDSYLHAQTCTVNQVPGVGTVQVIITPTVTPPPPPQPNTFYVAPNGIDTNPGTLQLPWKTLLKAGKVAAGSTVLISSGTYNEVLNVVNSGNTSQPIIFKAANPCVMNADYNVKPVCSTVLKGVNLNGKSYITIQGFDTPYIFVQDRYTLTSTGVNVVGNFIHDSPEYGIEARNTKTLSIEKNYIFNTTDGGITCRGSTDTVSIKSNVIMHTGTDGIRPSGKNITIDSNVIGASWEGVSHQDAIEIYNNVDGLIIKNNKIFDYTQLVYLSTYDGDLPIKNVQVLNNEMWCDKYCLAGNDAPGVMAGGDMAPIINLKVEGNKFTNLWNYIGDGYAKSSAAYISGVVSIQNNTCTLPRFTMEMHNPFTYLNNGGCK